MIDQCKEEKVFILQTTPTTQTTVTHVVAKNVLELQINEIEGRSELDEIPLALDQLSIPQSAKKVYEILMNEGPLTSGDLEDKCTYSDRTIRNALRRLMKIGLVRKVANFRDMRTSLFHAYHSNAT